VVAAGGQDGLKRSYCADGQLAMNWQAKAPTVMLGDGQADGLEKLGDGAALVRCSSPGSARVG
jgi:hypothetical protein